ncbi:unnamed protein product [Adineta ricciae]|uniref:Uncharacterized protein n=1 Tax=Adineta ricciae TaxID=249248 RepID=A0A816D095_ADIRI|nr:unnamed protein product [Adineta ricciae]CAF1626907.1 unnamed protein product [Adineta ricciae]
MQLRILLFISSVANFYMIVYAMDDSFFWNNTSVDFYNGLKQQIGNIQQKLNDQEKKISEHEQTIKKLPKFCYGTTNSDQWLPFNQGPSGLMMYINTTSCHFNQMPTYFTSLSGDSEHWTTTGMTSIYRGTSTGFTIFLYPDIGREPKQYSMERLAIRKWKLNWIGIVQGE